MSRLDWSEPEDGRHAVVLDAYRRLAELRRTVPALTDPHLGGVRATADDDARVFVLRRGDVELVLNLGDAAYEHPLEGTADVLLSTPTAPAPNGDSLQLPAGSGSLLRFGSRQGG